MGNIMPESRTVGIINYHSKNSMASHLGTGDRQNQ